MTEQDARSSDATEDGRPAAWDGRTDPYEEAKLARQEKDETRVQQARGQARDDVWTRLDPRLAYLAMLTAIAVMFSLTALILLIFLDPVSGFERVSLRACFAAVLLLVCVNASQRLSRAMVREEFRKEPSVKSGPRWLRTLQGPAIVAAILLLIHA